MSKNQKRSRNATLVALLAVGTLLASPTASTAATLPVLRLPAGVIGQVEGNAGAANVTLTVTMDRTSTTAVSVNYATANGTGTAADLDYVAATGTLIFAPGDTTQPITVTVNGDTKLEDYQTFSIKLSAPSGATIGTAQQTIEIRNDEKPKFAMATALAVSEGASAHFVPKLLQRYYLPISASAQTSNRTATTPADYTAGSVPLAFPAGSKIASNVDVATIADGIAEPKETFALTLTSPDAAAALTKLATINASIGSIACNTGQAAPAQYQKVVVFSFENRTWSQVGGVGFGAAALPYAHTLASSCAHFTTWTEANTGQNSATQYVSQGQGDTSHTVLSDCQPSATCNSQSDNIFRQARAAGKTAINYVEGASTPCSAGGNAAKHVPALYYWGANDQLFCTAQVRPYSEFNPNALADFSFVTPTLCNDGHDCANATVDTWMQQNIAPVIASADYQAGHVLIEIWYDEDSPAPNVYLAPSAHAGPLATAGIGYASTLKLWEEVLGLPCLANACTAPDLRPSAGV